MDKLQATRRSMQRANLAGLQFEEAARCVGHQRVIVDQETLAALVALAKASPSLCVFGMSGPSIAERALDRASARLVAPLEDVVIQTYLDQQESLVEWTEAGR